MVKRKEWERYYLYMALIDFWKKNLYGLIGGLLIAEKNSALEKHDVKREIKSIMDVKNVNELKKGGKVLQTF
jgi:hypothetical protein